MGIDICNVCDSFANIAPEICKFAFQNQNKGEKMWNVIIPAVVGTVAAVVAYAEGKNDGKKKQKKKHRRAEAERQRQIEEEIQRQVELGKQKEAERQRQITLQRQAEEEEQRQREQAIERKRLAVSTFANSFTSEVLQELTFERLENAEDDWEELCAIDKEARYARNIESNANLLSTSPYCKAIMQRLFDAYSARNIEELQALMEESEQIQRLAQSIESCSLSETLQQLTDERIADADTIEELQKIKREAFCACEIEQYCQNFDGLEEAYQNRDFGILQALRLRARQLKSPRIQPSSPPPRGDDGVSVVFGD